MASPRLSQSSSSNLPENVNSVASFMITHDPAQHENSSHDYQQETISQKPANTIAHVPLHENANSPGKFSDHDPPMPASTVANSVVSKPLDDSYEFEHQGIGRKPSKFEQGVTLTWKDLWVVVSSNAKSETRPLLQKLTGYAEPRQILAIMGPSGSGKSTLLDALAGRLASNTKQTGEILVDGRRQSLSYGNSAYVTQDDVLMATLTVKEAVYYSAQLQLPNSMSIQKKRERAESTIRDMGLQGVMNTQIGGWRARGLSGGEKRRVSIAIEILTRPRLLFLDEPTSGLDSAAAFHVINRLRNLALDERTVIASIHQPSSDVFELFTSLYLLSNGRTVYFGAAHEAREFFSTNGFPCPPLRNPSDHYLRTINKDFERDIEEGAAGVKLKTEEVINVLVKAYSQSEVALEVSRRVDGASGMEGAPLESLVSNGAGFFTRVDVLTRRSFKNMYRDLGYYWLRLAIYIALCLCVGTVYYKVGHSFSAIQARGAMLMFVAAFLTFMAIGGFPAFVEDMRRYGSKSMFEMMMKSNDFSNYMMATFNSYIEGQGRASTEPIVPPSSQVESSLVEDPKPKSVSPFLETPTYEQIFRPPKEADRDPTKLYGRTLLRKHYEEQHKIFLNHSRVRGWFKDVEVGDMRHNGKEQERVKDMIRSKSHEIQPLSFPGATYTWREEDIYFSILSLKQSQRKYRKRKTTMVTCSSKKKVLDESNEEEDVPNGDLHDNEEDVYRVDMSPITSCHGMDLAPSQCSNDGKDHDDDDNDGCDAYAKDIHSCLYKDLEDDGGELMEQSSYLKLLESVDGNVIQVGKTFGNDAPIIPSAKRSQRKKHMTYKMKAMIDDSLKHQEVEKSSPQDWLKNKRTSNSSGVTLDTIVSQYGWQDQDSIVMKFLDINIVEDLSRQLKLVWSCLVKKRKSIKSNIIEDQYGSMLKDVVDCLLQEGKVRIKNHRKPFLCIDDVEVLL